MYRLSFSLRSQLPKCASKKSIGSNSFLSFFICKSQAVTPYDLNGAICAWGILGKKIPCYVFYLWAMCSIHFVPLRMVCVNGSLKFNFLSSKFMPLMFSNSFLCLSIIVMITDRISDYFKLKVLNLLFRSNFVSTFDMCTCVSKQTF